MKSYTILLVEDDELDVISVQRSLKKLEESYQLITAYNGLEALSLLTGAVGSMPLVPDVILLDLNMPKMNGIEFLRELRKIDQFAETKVFVMTTSGDEPDRKAAEALGISGYIIKPLNFTDNNKRTDSMDAFFQFHIRKILAE